MKKILIIGNCGSGKTTFSRKLAYKLQLPLIHLDQHYWGLGWTKPSTKKWRKKIKHLVSGKTWIIEGNYISSFDIRIPASDTIIVLDFPKVISLWRLFKRFFVSFGKVRPEIGGNNIEKVDLAFLKWVLSQSREEIITEIKKYQQKQELILIKSPKELKDFLNNIEAKKVLC